jgi:membrane associated rhomboid family serine protease
MKANPYHREFGSTLEALLYPILLLALLWSIFSIENFHKDFFIQLGILPKEWSGLIGVLLSPLIHDPHGPSHLLSNSLPAALLTGTLVYYYRKIALRIFVISWLSTGTLVWLLAEQNGHYHIGFSGVIYALAAFLFTSGTLRKYRPLQAISLFVAFYYGSMIWGILPIQEGVSWEGHYYGLASGILLAFIYQKQGPQAPKFQYEIEKDLGIEPPDLEGIWLENQRLAEESRRQFLENQNTGDPVNSQQPTEIRYIYLKKDQTNPPPDGTAQ